MSKSSTSQKVTNWTSKNQKIKNSNTCLFPSSWYFRQHSPLHLYDSISVNDIAMCHRMLVFCSFLVHQIVTVSAQLSAWDQYFLNKMMADYIKNQQQNGTMTTVKQPDDSRSLNLVSVEIRLGEIQGQLYTTPGGAQMKLFWNIQYAEKPGRFEIPKPKKPWQGLMDSTVKPGMCPQIAKSSSVQFAVPDSNSDEDCLSLKLMVPVPSASKKFPVLFWPHGGGFLAGSHLNYDTDSQGDHIVSKGIIIAQPSYRVGPFGFFSTGTKTARGNYGMWDILRALQFLHRNIRSFGGDPEQIILMGHGAGGTAVSLLTFSPLAQRLFSGAIILSASAFAPRVNQPESTYLEKNRNFAIIAGCDRTDGVGWAENRSDIFRCLRQKSVPDLLIAASKLSKDESMFWHPTPDGKHGIWPAPLEQLALRRKNIPIIIGTSNNEQSWDIIVKPAIRRRSKQINMTLLNTPQKVRDECSLRVTKADFPQATNQVRKACSWQYADSILRGDYSRMDFLNPMFWLSQSVKVGSNLNYHAPVFNDVSYYIKNGNRNVYLYSFDYLRKQGGPWWITAASFHNLDMAYIENVSPGDKFLQFPMVGEDKDMQQLWFSLVTNFVKTKNPNPIDDFDNVIWFPLAAPEGYNYLSIDMPPKMKPYFHIRDVFFWNNFLPVIQNTVRDNILPTYTLITFNDSRTVTDTHN